MFPSTISKVIHHPSSQITHDFLGEVSRLRIFTVKQKKFKTS
jgi:hypothetical protein